MAKLICPICGDATAFSPLRLVGKGTLATELEGDDWHLRKVALDAVIDERYVKVQDIIYAILTCQSCKKWFIVERKRSSVEWVAVYPISYKPVSIDINEPVKEEFEEANLCFAIGAYRACVAMCQIALEALWRDQESASLKDLESKGIISSGLRERAEEIRLWGNVAKHELIAEPIIKEDAEQILSYLEILLDHIYVAPKRLELLKQKREQIENK